MLTCSGLLKATAVFALFATFAIHFFMVIPLASEVEFKGQKIAISRDEYGIPEIDSPSLDAAMYAWGWTQAEDRLFQMGFRRILGQGRLAELFGEKAFPIDVMMRNLDFIGWAEKVA